MTRTLIAVMLVIVSALPSNVASAQSLHFGKAVVVDGDTIKIREIQVRFFGIDAPEKGQLCRSFNGEIYRCGQRSGAYLRRLIGGRQVRCQDLGQAKFSRRWGRCFVGKVNLQSAMVRAGHARAYSFHSDEYIGEQNIARKMRQGIWQGFHV